MWHRHPVRFCCYASLLNYRSTVLGCAIIQRWMEVLQLIQTKWFVLFPEGWTTSIWETFSLTSNILALWKKKGTSLLTVMLIWVDPSSSLLVTKVRINTWSADSCMLTTDLFYLVVFPSDLPACLSIYLSIYLPTSLSIHIAPETPKAPVIHRTDNSQDFDLRVDLFASSSKFGPLRYPSRSLLPVVLLIL